MLLYYVVVVVVVVTSVGAPTKVAPVCVKNNLLAAASAERVR